MQEIIEQIKSSAAPAKNYWLNQLARNANNKKKYEQLQYKIIQELDAIKLRKALVATAKISYPPELPVSQELNSIKTAILENQITIVCGETGSGKTTQLPKILLELGFGINGLIGHTQPRRIAAKTLAKRINEELGYANYEHGVVGCKMRFHDRTTLSTAIKLMTDGILLQEIQTDRLLLQYSAIIIDEVHERSLNIDFILGYLHHLCCKRPDLKIIITSATLETGKLSAFFGGAPIVNVSGKTYPVDIIYQPVHDDEDKTGLNEAIYQAIIASLSIELGNGLVFLPGEREIKDCLNFLRKTKLGNYELLPLFARQNNEAQAHVFNNSGRIKIILATNIAETSLTIPGIKFVIDSGYAKVKRYSIRNKVEQLQIEPNSQASGNQRAGRAGRVSHGICVRLFSETQFKLRKEFTEPELLRSNLANVILRMLALNIGDPLAFNFLDRPENKAFNDGYRSLFQLEAIDAQNKITTLGRKLAQIPVDIQLSRILVAAGEKYDCLEEALVIVAFLAIADPRETPLEQQQSAYARHQIWADKDSAFNQILNLWKWYHQELAHKKSNKKLLESCYKQFVSLIRLREWHELHRVLKEIMLNLGYKLNTKEGAYREIHSAILHGFILNIGQKDQVLPHYIGTNGKKFFIHPGESTAAHKWLVSATLMETTRLYARNCAKIEPQWLNNIARHLFKYNYHNPRFDKKRGEVIATKLSLLYGLLIDEHKVSYGPINPLAAREIFIREAIVANQLTTAYQFIDNNLKVVEKLEKLEDKLRSYTLIMDDELFEFYTAALPAEVIDEVTLNQYITQHGDARLKLDQKELMAKINKGNNIVELFPDYIVNNQEQIKLSYIFDHDNPEDGVVATLDISQINKIDAQQFDWLVPGLIRDKITYILKALPKNQRLQFNPLADAVTEFLETASSANSTDNLYQQLILYAKRRNIPLDYQALLKIELPRHLCFHFRVMQNNKLIASNENLTKLHKELAPQLSKLITKNSAYREINNLSGFIPEFSDLLQEAKLTKFSGYYSLIVEKDNSVTFGVVSDLRQAVISTHKGLTSLIKLKLKDQIKYLQDRKLADFKTISLALREYYTGEQLAHSLTHYIINQAIRLALAPGIPTSPEAYSQYITNSRQNINELVLKLNMSLREIAALYQQIKLEISNHPLQEEIEEQLNDMLFEEFLAYTKWQYLINFPRYLQGIIIRLDKYAKSPVKDAGIAHEINQLYDKWYNYLDDLEQNHKVIKTELYDFKYKIEELRISLFAQGMGTLYPVSVKRLGNELEELYTSNL